MVDFVTLNSVFSVITHFIEAVKSDSEYKGHSHEGERGWGLKEGGGEEGRERGCDKNEKDNIYCFNVRVYNNVLMLQAIFVSDSRHAVELQHQRSPSRVRSPPREIVQANRRTASRPTGQRRTHQLRQREPQTDHHRGLLPCQGGSNLGH